VRTDITADAGETEGQGMLFRIPSASATSIHQEKRKTASDRAAKIAEIVRAEAGEAWIIWVDTDYDAEAIKALLPDATEVHGRMTPEQKEEGLAAFSEGRERILITKSSIAGFGLNWQHCARVAFMGLSYSYEAFYQAVRRCWRYGQTRSVEVHIASAETEEAIWQAIARKRGDHDSMKVQMRAAMARAQHGLDPLGGLHFRHRDQLHRARCTSRSALRLRDSGFDFAQSHQALLFRGPRNTANPKKKRAGTRPALPFVQIRKD
jgi:superfamily II DNA/RNA helicase